MNEEEILDYDENIYQKLARATARAVDINLGKTTLADLLDGYTKSGVLQQRIDKAIEYIKNEISLIDKDLIECELTYAEKWNFENARDKYVSVLEILGDKE